MSSPPAKSASTPGFEAPHPGAQDMPRWDAGELIKPPHFHWGQLAMFIGPSLVMAASAVGGGEWLTGPLVTAKYGAALLWLATFSILGQVIYNIEICRYTLYTGEPIFTGKFRTLPGPMFWPWIYLFLDFGSFLPYLASNAAIPLAALIRGEIPDAKADELYLKQLGAGIFVACMLPMLFGGKVYTSLRYIMTFKLIVVMGFLGFLALGYSTWDNWREIGAGFVSVGNVPVLSEGESKGDVANVFSVMFSGQSMPPLDLTMIGFIAAMAAISGNGGLTNTPVSNFTRDQGWGMGYHVGAIPSIIGGKSITLSHSGTVFEPNQESLPRWRGWMRHVQREQMMLWAPACFAGIALPCMLSLQFLQRGNVPKNAWLAAGMTADGVAGAVGPTFGPFFWYLTLFCGFLILGTAMITTADGVLRRWVDVAWTASSRLRTWDTRDIGKFYFSMLCIYLVGGVTMLFFLKGDKLVIYATMAYNYALGFSCWHVIVVNRTLLPKPLRPSLWRQGWLALAGCFFTVIAVIATVDQVQKLRAEAAKAEAAAPSAIVAPAANDAGEQPAK